MICISPEKSSLVIHADRNAHKMAEARARGCLVGNEQIKTQHRVQMAAQAKVRAVGAEKVKIAKRNNP